MESFTPAPSIGKTMANTQLNFSKSKVKT